MTLHKLFAKLRTKNRGQYLILGFCIFLSVLLLTSLALMYLSPTVQDFLPQGGDTRKLATLLIAVTTAGCTIFTLYASGLFFRYKSREYGIFLALGTSKKQLNPLLFRELGSIAAVSSAVGLILSMPVSFLIWKLFETFLISTGDTPYRFGFKGFFLGVGFAVILTLLLFCYGMRFVKRSDVMDILRTSHKTEMVKLIPSWTGKVGIVFVIAGLVIAMFLPFLSARVLGFRMPSFINAFYLLTLAGIYLVMLGIVAQARAGKNRGKYYKNLVSISMMRFTAKSTAKNMCVIALLLFTSIFAVFYSMLYSDISFLEAPGAQSAYTFHTPAEEDQFSSEEIYALADEYDMEIENFAETEAANLVISRKHKDLTDDGKYNIVDSPEGKLALFLPVSVYNQITGQEITVNAGGYKTVVAAGSTGNFWEGEDGLYAAFNPDTEETYPLQYEGTAAYTSLAQTSDPYLYLLSDEDYAVMTASLSDTYKESLISFDVKDYEASYPFAEALANAYISHAGELSDHMALYDAWEEKLLQEKGETYGYTGDGFIPDIDTLMVADWKYEPYIQILLQQNYLQGISVYVILCLYIFIIALSAVTIIAYVRSISIATDNRELFESLKKLGASRSYRKAVLKKQLAKLFAYPVVAGCLLAILYAVFMSVTNDGVFTKMELANVSKLTGLAVGIWLFFYLIYRRALKKAGTIVGV